eukprot:5162089-Amphidinium_carterae.2
MAAVSLKQPPVCASGTELPLSLQPAVLRSLSHCAHEVAEAGIGGPSAVLCPWLHGYAILLR